VREVVDRKIAGEAITTSEPEPARAQVIDLMEALKASLSRPKTKGGTRTAAAPEPRRAVAAAKRSETPARRARKKQ
jgi:DNA end-binding protein Ku